MSTSKIQACRDLQKDIRLLHVPSHCDLSWLLIIQLKVELDCLVWSSFVTGFYLCLSLPSGGLKWIGTKCKLTEAHFNFVLLQYSFLLNLRKYSSALIHLVYINLNHLQIQNTEGMSVSIFFPLKIKILLHVEENSTILDLIFLKFIVKLTIIVVIITKIKLLCHKRRNMFVIILIDKMNNAAVDLFSVLNQLYLGCKDVQLAKNYYF